MVRGAWKRLIAAFSSSSTNAANTKEEESMCAICLDPLNHCTSAVFRAKCGHAFHFSCISSYLGHGGVTCPICRALWARLPRNTPARYDGDEPLPVGHPHRHHRLLIDLCSRPSPVLIHSSSAAYDACVSLEHPPPTDLVLAATATAPYMRQAMALLMLSLRPLDRLSIVAHSAHISPLVRMTPYAKQTALQLLHRFFHFHNKPCSAADAKAALNNGIQVLHDRVYTNPQSHILHLSHSPAHLEVEQFLTRMLHSAATQIQIKMDGRIVQVGELRGGEHRKLPLLLPKCGHYCAEYSYIDGGTNKVAGKMLIRIQNDAHYGSAETSLMPSRRAKHLHGNS